MADIFMRRHSLGLQPGSARLRWTASSLLAVVLATGALTIVVAVTDPPIWLAMTQIAAGALMAL